MRRVPRRVVLDARHAVVASGQVEGGYSEPKGGADAGRGGRPHCRRVEAHGGGESEVDPCPPREKADGVRLVAGHPVSAVNSTVVVQVAVDLDLSVREISVVVPTRVGERREGATRNGCPACGLVAMEVVDGALSRSQGAGESRGAR